MTEQDDLTLGADILNPILREGLPGLPQAVSLLINAAKRQMRSARSVGRELVQLGNNMRELRLMRM